MLPPVRHVRLQTNEEIRQKIREGHRYKAGTRSFFAKAATPCFRTCLSTAFLFFFLDILALKMNTAYAVPDPEPKLLDSNFVEPSKLQLLFRPSGKYAASTHYIHVRVPFNFSRLTLMPSVIFDRYHRYIEVWPEPSRTSSTVCSNTTESHHRPARESSQRTGFVTETTTHMRSRGSSSVLTQILLNLCLASLTTCSKIYDIFAPGEKVRPRVNVRTGNQTTSWLFDTGAAITCMNSRSFNSAFGNQKPKKIANACPEALFCGFKTKPKADGTHAKIPVSKNGTGVADRWTTRLSGSTYSSCAMIFN